MIEEKMVLMESTLELKKEVFDLNVLVEQTVRDIKLTNTQRQMQIFHSNHAKVFADKIESGRCLLIL